MTMQTMDFISAVDGKLVIHEQRAAGWSNLLLDMQINPDDVREGAVGEQEFLDGMVLPCETFSLVSLDGASGKSTSSRKAGLSAAARGHWTMFGTKQHPKPLRVAMIFGEETKKQIIRSIIAIPGALEDYNAAISSGRLLIVSMPDYLMTAPKPQAIFDDKGYLSDFGSEFFRDLGRFDPDVLIIDTITSVSDSEFLDTISPRNMMNALNAFCDRHGCTGIGYMHLVKDAAGKISETSSPDEYLSLARGSGMLRNVARSQVVATRAPKGLYSGITTENVRDEIWVGTTKCNLVGADYNHKLFPILRDATDMILTAHIGGRSLAEDVEVANRAATRELMEYLPHLIRAASDDFKPFAISPRNKMSLQFLLTGSLSSLIDATLSPSLITSALEALVAEGKIVICSNTRSGAGQVYCYPDGMFANQTQCQEITKEKLKIREGDYRVEELRASMQSLHARPADAPGTDADWMIKAKAEAAARQAEKGTEAKDKATDVEIRETLRAARARKDQAKGALKVASDQLVSIEQKHRIAAAELKAHRHAAQANPSAEADAKVDFRASELATAEADLHAVQAAVAKAKADLARAEQDIVDATERSARLAGDRVRPFLEDEADQPGTDAPF